MCVGGTGEGGEDWGGGGDGLRKEAGRLGLGARQSGESEGLGLLGRSLCGGESLQSFEEWVLGR